MNLLLDTHALIWWLTDDPRLSRRADAEIRAAEVVFISAVSAWEATLKHRYGKLPAATVLVRDFSGEIAAEGFEALALTVEHAALAARMDNSHKDPFDRMLIAQALTERLTLVSNERLFDTFGVARLW